MLAGGGRMLSRRIFLITGSAAGAGLMLGIAG